MQRADMTDGTPGDQIPADAIRIDVGGEYVRQYQRMREALQQIQQMAYWKGTRMQEIAREALRESTA